MNIILINAILIKHFNLPINKRYVGRFENVFLFLFPYNEYRETTSSENMLDIMRLTLLPILSILFSIDNLDICETN